MFNLKNYRALASGAYTATLYRDGKRIATVEDRGDGGEPWIHPTVGPRATIEADLTAWAEANLPDWYLTMHGAWERLTPDWSLALGYLVECIEYGRAARGGRLVRLPNGQMYRYPPTTPVPTGATVWQDGDWIAA